ncbi:unnamed protein product [Brachionus calyciflorus]|uniref:Uncharacterized protein n=1 Tax=Brachionus calyciflorus TaxID=104777 RepID=A0A814C9S5_9BILA|nr:unnamed protein product [Brachionus calyciflorus]
MYLNSNNNLPTMGYAYTAQQRDQYGNPVYTIHPQAYQMNLAFRQEIVRQQREHAIKMVEENYPNKFALIYACLIIFIGVSLIVLQIVSIVNNGALAYVGSGIWGGFLCIFLGVLALSLIKWKNYCLIIVAFVAHITSIAILIASLIMINSMGLAFYGFSIYNFNKGMMPVNIVMLVLGVISFVLCLSFLIMMCKIDINRRPAVSYQPGVTVYPNNMQNPVLNQYNPNLQAYQMTNINNPYSSNVY